MLIFQKDHTNCFLPFLSFHVFQDVVSNDRLCFVPRSGSLYSDLRQSPNSYIRSVMAETKRQDLFISFGEMNNATYVNSLGKNVILHHRAFGKAFGFETGREVVFNAHQV